MLPGLVDCHTHLPFAGWRAEEYERKVTGVPYEEIARLGGGIASSARALAAASDDDVLAQAEGLAAELLQHGTTAFEGKTGYGLSRDGEARAARLGRELAARVVQPMRLTGLFAHAVPPGFTADGWMDEAEALARECDVDALDIFVESVAFGLEQLDRMGAIARGPRAAAARARRAALHDALGPGRAAPRRALGRPPLGHPPRRRRAARGVRDRRGAAARRRADERRGDGRRRARSPTPARSACSRPTSTPGTSPIASLPVIIGLAVRRYGWSVREALLATTLNAAYVLGWSAELGSLEPGKRADAIVLDGPAEHLPYRFGHNPVAAVFVAGELAWVRPDQAWRVRA